MLPSGVPRKGEVFVRVSDDNFSRTSFWQHQWTRPPTGIWCSPTRRSPAESCRPHINEGGFDAFCPFCGIVLDGIFIALAVLKPLVVDGIKRIAVVAVALLQRVFGLAAGGNHGTDLIGDIDFRNLAGGKLVLDYHEETPILVGMEVLMNSEEAVRYQPQFRWR